tara:strand:- start:151 stop:798 length:648 start_codon:yes stop_codon:yes gene_type:complete
MAYGDLKVNNLIYDAGSGEVTKAISDIPQSASPTFTGDITINAQGDVRFADADSSNYIAFQAPATVASNVTLTWPATSPNGGEVLKADASSPTTLTWSSDTGIPVSGGTFTGSVTFEDAINETVFAITDAASVALDPDNGLVQTWTLGASRTATDSLTTGQSMQLVATAGSYAITWPTMQWIGGSAPTLSSSSTTVIELWKVGAVLYGASIGDPS